jgi:broad specificity phosphatase PhoE
MGTLHLVRHGQASFGSDDYDRLSPLGAQQCEALGRHFGEQGLAFSAVLRGTLRRHEQSLAAIASTLPGLPEPLLLPGLNEYHSEALVQAWMLASGAPPLPALGSAEGHRAHFRALREALLAWMAARIEPAGMPSWVEFRSGVVSALDHVRRSCEGDVLLVSSGGPIATAVAAVLGAPDEAMVELNLRIRNSAVSEFHFTPKRHALQGFNAVPHLLSPERRGWVSYA